MPKNNCSCPDPLGGTVECEANQLAICSVKRGKIEAKCVSLPSGLSHTPMQNLILENVTGIPRKASALLNSDDFKILSSQTYADPGRALIVKFKVPAF